MMQNKTVEISYFKAWKGKQLAINQLRGDPVKSFKLHPAYLYMIEQVNPGSTTHLKVNEDGSFKYMFLAYRACIAGFRYMRKVISVDGTYLTGKYKGVLLIATAQDGNHHQYPIAWAVVDSECEESWTWFFEKLHELISDDVELLFISDRHKRIINGLASVYKQARHGHCIWHLGQNIKLGPKSKVGGIALFMQAAKAYKQVEFGELYEKMKNSYPGITKYLEASIDREKWAIAYFPGSRYNIMTTNGSESINAKLVFARELTMIALLDAIQSLISSWFNNHRKAAVASTRHLTPWA
ncbi:protein FAR1-RELATED SEQUENCE 6-like [Primulina eburnea]|uniref:protein FAR1-RELATED SEQUENCE 6-like n=1 Tax=Primulina eburnea TaxID=1245227 RepID=UPI003C6C8C91